MKIEITNDMKNKIEQMVSICEQSKSLKKEYPRCWEILKKQYQLWDYMNSDFIEDDMDNVKIKLYAEIISADTIKQKSLNAKVAKQAHSQSKTK